MNELPTKLVTPDDACITLQRFGNVDSPRLVFSHGNGFSVDAFRSLTSSLAQWANVLAFDLRNHGRNPTHSLRQHTQQHLREDMVTVTGAGWLSETANSPYGLFHSISGVHALYTQVHYPKTFSGLVLLEPPISPSSSHVLYEELVTVQAALVQAALRRRDHFDSPQELLSRLRERRAFQSVSDSDLEIYCEGVLRAVPDGWTLSCPREFEAAGYQQNLDDGLYDAVRAISIPVLIVASKQTSLRRTLAQELADHAGFDLLLLEDITHLMPLEVPSLISSLAQSYLCSR